MLKLYHHHFLRDSHNSNGELQLSRATEVFRHSRFPSPLQSMRFSWATHSPARLLIDGEAWGTSVTVTNPATSQTVCTFEDKDFRDRAVLKDPLDRILVTIKDGGIFEGDQTQFRQFLIHDIQDFFETMLLSVEFVVDRKTGTLCRFAAKGSSSAKVVLCHLEQGNPSFSQLVSAKDFDLNQSRYQPIDRIQRGHVDSPSTLLLLLWRIRYDYLRPPRTRIGAVGLVSA